MQNENKYSEEKQQNNMLHEINKILENTKHLKSFKEEIKLYGIINYTRTQFLPRISNHITQNPEHKDIFFNYTSIESMILDLLMVIESDLIQQMEDNEDKTDKIKELLIFSTKLLKTLEKMLTNKYEKLTQRINDEEYERKLEKYSAEVFNQQNNFYTLVYNEKVDSRIKQ